jgi:hypothetical protein
MIPGQTSKPPGPPSLQQDDQHPVPQPHALYLAHVVQQCRLHQRPIPIPPAPQGVEHVEGVTLIVAAHLAEQSLRLRRQMGIYDR